MRAPVKFRPLPLLENKLGPGFRRVTLLHEFTFMGRNSEPVVNRVSLLKKQGPNNIFRRGDSRCKISRRTLGPIHSSKKKSSGQNYFGNHETTRLGWGVGANLPDKPLAQPSTREGNCLGKLAKQADRAACFKEGCC